MQPVQYRPSPAPLSAPAQVGDAPSTGRPCDSYVPAWSKKKLFAAGLVAAASLIPGAYSSLVDRQGVAKVWGYSQNVTLPADVTQPVAPRVLGPRVNKARLGGTLGALTAVAVGVGTLL